MIFFQCLMLLLCFFLTESMSCKEPESEVPACAAFEVVMSKQRVRRELREVSKEQWNRIVAAIWVMKNTTMVDGLSLYGSTFKSYDYLVAMHGVNIFDSRGDQGHFVNAFGTFHGAFLLLFEESLLAVDPSIESLPYWDATWDVLDNVEYFGSANGAGAEGTIENGRFAFFPVGRVKKSIDSDYVMYIRSVPNVFQGFNGSQEGYLRGPDNANRNPYVARFGTAWTYDYDKLDSCATNPPCWRNWSDCILPFHHTAHQILGGGGKRSEMADAPPADVKPKVEEGSNHINLTVKSQDQTEMHFKIKRNTKLEKLMNVYCQRQAVPRNSIVFIFDGERIVDTATPDELSMEDGDRIDAMLSQVGGQ